MQEVRPAVESTARWMDACKQAWRAGRTPRWRPAGAARRWRRLQLFLPPPPASASQLPRPRCLPHVLRPLRPAARAGGPSGAAGARRWTAARGTPGGRSAGCCPTCPRRCPCPPRSMSSQRPPAWQADDRTHRPHPWDAAAMPTCHARSAVRRLSQLKPWLQQTSGSLSSALHRVCTVEPLRHGTSFARRPTATTSIRRRGHFNWRVDVKSRPRRWRCLRWW